MTWCFAAGSALRLHHLQVLSLVYRLLRCLCDLLAVLVQSDLSKDIEPLVLPHENQVRFVRPEVGRAYLGIIVESVVDVAKWPCGRLAAGPLKSLGHALSVVYLNSISSEM
jgi:hypothetical protein